MQYGSAVLVGKNLLLTNAHVITDEDDKLTLHYEACQTVSPELPAECFSTLKLIKYDIKNDLALLEIQESLPVEVDPVSFGETEISIGTRIKIL
jgi:S1-C subfamily serine protease